ncbi:hypothetical protein TCAP_00591 [Tolypocladium capitatum]|uniref:Uncharacterized protein n=1 Tax=Tolypocladium capitatum TaxID=45235 RepID=A0A2K3QPM6_9HYPO|nr:hypothetical protein TCAP_00591 [Tolypocladium capitatum]
MFPPSSVARILLKPLVYPSISNCTLCVLSPSFAMSDKEVCHHPAGLFGMDPCDLLPDDPEGVYRPLLCPNCHARLPSNQTNGYLCNGPDGSCLRDLSAPRRLMFIEAATGNCAGRCRSRLSHRERSEHTLICNFCIELYEPLARELLRRVQENKTARHTPTDRGNGREGICGNPQCEDVVFEEDLYSFPDEFEHSLATICPKCYVTATLVSLGRPYLERQRDGLRRAGLDLSLGHVDFDGVDLTPAPPGEIEIYELEA